MNVDGRAGVLVVVGSGTGGGGVGTTCRAGLVVLGQVERFAHLLGLAQIDKLGLLASIVALLAGVEQLHERHGRAAQHERGEEHQYERGRDDHVPHLLVDLQVEAERERNGAAQAAEPHDELHAFGDLVLAKVVEQDGERKDVARATQQAHDDAGGDQAGLEAVLEAEYGQAEVGEHARLRYEREGAEDLLDGDARHRRQVQVRVVGHDEAGEEDGHDAREADRLGEHVRRVHEYEHEGGLQRRRSAKIHILEKLDKCKRTKLI